MEDTSNDYDKNVPPVPPELCGPFLDSGDSSDEIVLSFDDGKKLYVSENFLSYASPVFRAMFKHDFKEKETREVAMKEKSFDDFLEFLLCLHPGEQKPIGNDNVLRVVSLAQEYQVKGSVTRYQEVMKNWLTQETETAAKLNDSLQKAEHAITSLKILTKAVFCGYEEVVTHAIRMIARFGHDIFTGTDNQEHAFGYAVPSKSVGVQVRRSNTRHIAQARILPQGIPTHLGSTPNPKQECKRLFENLPEDIKTQLLLERLKICDGGHMR